MGSLHVDSDILWRVGRKALTMIEVRFEPLTDKHNRYTVVIDGEVFCTTEDDNKGFDLMITVEKMRAIRNH